MTTLHARSGTAHPLPARTISVAYTPDSDDAFMFHAWEHGEVVADGFDPIFRRDHIAILNASARTGRHDVLSISSVVYPSVADQYLVLAAGSSVGRGYGPVLVALAPISVADLRGRRVAVAGRATTGGALAAMYCSDAELVQMPYDRIAEAILDGIVAAGVMIHEELVHFPALGLHRVLDLGAQWCDETGLPLPVGLNVAHRRLGVDGARAACRATRDSLRWALAHPDSAMDSVRALGRGRADDFVPMFANDDTECMPADVRSALRPLFERVAGLGLGPRLRHWEIVDA